MRRAALVTLSLCLLACGSGGGADFGLTLIATPDGRNATIADFYLDHSCGMCHTRQLREVKGSMHAHAHTDPLYRAFALLAALTNHFLERAAVRLVNAAASH